MPVCFVWARVFAAVYADLDFNQSRGAWLILRIKCVIGGKQKKINVYHKKGGFIIKTHKKALFIEGADL